MGEGFSSFAEKGTIMPSIFMVNQIFKKKETTGEWLGIAPLALAQGVG